MAVGGGDDVDGGFGGGEVEVDEVVGFDGELHGVGAHISCLHDADVGDGDAFGVALAGNQEDFVFGVGGDTADYLFSGANFQGLDTLRDAPHQGNPLGGEG